ncbi:helix-turn-helix transcriptional regulator [Diplocloster hominis]|uniref:helix-turn-helix domain-containing protein n=1 Tax=Diplocloster hominis TaxID=3079010 RepID=UPI0031BBB9EB
MEIYTRISEMAKKKGVSINMIEKEAKLSTGSICKWNIVSPTVRNLKKVADFLQCSIDDFLN